MLYLEYIFLNYALIRLKNFYRSQELENKLYKVPLFVNIIINKLYKSSSILNVKSLLN